MVDSDHFVGKVLRYGSTNHAISALHPFGVGKWVVIRVITWITGVETIKLQTMLQVKVRECGLRLWPTVCTPALSVTQKRLSSCGMQLAALCKCYMSMRLPLKIKKENSW